MIIWRSNVNHRTIDSREAHQNAHDAVTLKDHVPMIDHGYMFSQSPVVACVSGKVTATSACTVFKLSARRCGGDVVDLTYVDVSRLLKLPLEYIVLNASGLQRRHCLGNLQVLHRRLASLTKYFIAHPVSSPLVYCRIVSTGMQPRTLRRYFRNDHKLHPRCPT
jgi:hypothetical protein